MALLDGETSQVDGVSVVAARGIPIDRDQSREVRRWRSALRAVCEATILAPAIALALQTPVQAGDTEYFIVKVENMSPRLEIKQRVEFDLAAYRREPPQVGDIVLIHPPRGAILERCGSLRHAAPDKLCVAPSAAQTPGTCT